MLWTEASDLRPFHSLGSLERVRAPASRSATLVEAIFEAGSKQFWCFMQGKNFGPREVSRLRTRTRPHVWEEEKKKGKGEKHKLARDYAGRAD